MTELSADQFPDFFEALHKRAPYAWQSDLAARAVEGNWPDAIDLPTGSGKTACIDIAIFALACQAGRPLTERKAPRRIFFCVNRRVIVDEAHRRACAIAHRLAEAEQAKPSGSPVLAHVAAALRRLAGTEVRDDIPPLDVLELRGGIYRDNRWARSPVQPTVICTTIDQLGSRLLFRGYGLSPSAAPIQAALAAYDSLILLDEAHISRPFLQTLGNLGRFLHPNTWATEPIGVRPMTVVPMTATPPESTPSAEIIRLDDRDRENASLSRRLKAPKPALLQLVADVPGALVAHAATHMQAGPSAIGIIVNRVATARDIHRRLCENHPEIQAELVIGAIRPLDRDRQSDRLAPLVGHERPQTTHTPSIVVATQCLEVGADYDFDVLLTECASLDALRQRFGRLNRAGRPIDARALVVVNQKEVKPDDSLDETKPLDPIYGNAAARTWNWLWQHADTESPAPGEPAARKGRGKAKPAAEARTVDFGIDAFTKRLEEHTSDARIPATLLALSASLNAPVLLPAYVDFWCQTSPTPVPDPDIALFIHGAERGEPDVRVCWRADLLEDAHMNPDDHWCDVVALLPPTSAECMSLPLSRVRRWLTSAEDGEGQMSDLLEAAAPSDDPRADRTRNEPSLRCSGVLWRGPRESTLIGSPRDLRPGDTLVLPADGPGRKELGHIPDDHPDAEPPEIDKAAPSPADLKTDIAEAAFRSARDRYALRLHPFRNNTTYAQLPSFKDLLDRAADLDEPPNAQELRDLMRKALDDLPPDQDSPRDALAHFLAHGFIRDPYPDRRGIVITGRRRLRSAASPFLPALDEGDDDASRLGRGQPVTLDDHTRHVRDALGKLLKLIPTGLRPEAFDLAAECHDWGKADDRFQALLRGTDRTDAWLSAGAVPVLLAKSGGKARERFGLPDGFRHEMLSAQLAEAAGLPPELAAERDLILHLIDSHHGYARPLAPVALDDDPPDVQADRFALSSAERRQRPPHRLNSGIAERFWLLTRRHGWWGLAYLESLLRLADQQASADEDAGRFDSDNSSGANEPNS